MREIKPPVVLLVEDSDDDAFFFCRTLQKSGLACSLTHVTDGGQAIKLLEEAATSNHQNLPHTIFLDLKMPVRNGFEVLEWMRTQEFPCAMNVIVLSGSDHEMDKERARQLGAAAYLVKPIRVGDLLRLLQDICPREMGAHV